MKFIQVSHVNLGLSAPKDWDVPFDLKEERSEDFYNILKTCREQSVDVLFITGNLFAAPPTRAELEALDERFLELEDTRVFWLTGTKDAPYDPLVASAFQWKSRTTVFSGDSVQRIYVARLNAEITGVGYSPVTWHKVNLESLTRGKKGAMQVLVLPFIGENEASEFAGNDKPSLPFDYIGFGQDRMVKGDSLPHAFSAGALSPRDFDGQPRHGYFEGILDIDEEKQVSLRMKFIQSVKHDLITLRVKATEDMAYDAVEEEVRRLISENGPENIYEIVLTGETSPSLFFMKEKLSELGYVVRITDETNRENLTKKLDQSDAGEAIKRFAEALPEDEDSELRKKAMIYGFNAILYHEDRTGKEGAGDDYSGT